MNKFNFGKKDKKSESEQARESAEDRVQAALEKAQKLLHSKDCKDFLDDYKQAEREVIDVLIKYSKEELDTSRFGSGARVLLLQLVNLRALINSIHAKAGEKYTNA